MIIALTVLFFVIAVILMIIILIQPGGEGGLGFIGGGSRSAFGTKTGNIITRLTTFLAALFFLVSFALGYLNSRTSRIDTRELQKMKEAAEELPAPSFSPEEVGGDIGVDISDTNR